MRHRLIVCSAGESVRRSQSSKDGTLGQNGFCLTVAAPVFRSIELLTRSRSGATFATGGARKGYPRECRVSPVRSITICVAIGSTVARYRILRAVSANAQTQQRNVRGKLTVSRGSLIIIGMHPDVRRDLPLFRELDHVHRRGAGAKARYLEQIVGACASTRNQS